MTTDSSKSTILIAAGLGIAVLILAVYFQPRPPAPDPAPAPTPVTPSAAKPPCLAPPSVTYQLPADAELPRQPDMNCFAWQQFIALNWRASATRDGEPDQSAPASSLGEPSPAGTPAPAVWETFALGSDVFRPGAATPVPFLQPESPRALRMTGRNVDVIAGGAPPSDLSSIHQAFTNSWITAQNRQLTYYEIRLNGEEYDYIVTNKLYDAREQWAAIQAGTGIHLPDGSAPNTVGAIEVKAAWLPLTDPALYSRYLTAPAAITNPANGTTTNVIVGLVGLHIIHKTELAQQFVWATFEHVDNVPTLGAIGAGPYTYYNLTCDPATDKYKCAVNTQPPACKGSACDYTAPLQIARAQPLHADTDALNQYAQGVIRAANPDSVLQYYQLVSVMWPNNNTKVTGVPKTPLTGGNPQPPAGVGGLANTALETFFQVTGTYSPNKSLSQPSCLACHTVAAISPKGVPPGTKGANFASDYSFLFGLADVPPPVAPASAPASSRR